MITDIQCYSFLFVVSFLISTLLIRSIFNKPTGFHLMPSPPALPIIGHLQYLFFTPSLYNSLHRLSTKYGPLLYLRLGATRCVLVSSATFAAEIFTTHDLAFASRPIFAFADKLQFETSRFFTAPYGDYWRFMKKLSVTQLLSTRQIERSVAVRREEMEMLLRRVLERKDGVVDVGAELMRLTNNVTCRMVMSSMCSKEGGEAERVRELVKESFELVEKICFGDVLGPLKNLSFWMYGKQAMDLTRRYDELLERAMKEHEERGNGRRDDGGKDLIDILLEVSQDEQAEVRITRTHIKVFIMDLFIAGTETSANAMQWAIAELINHPCVFKKVREEIESVVGKTRLVEESDIPNLPYLQAVVKEALRLHPPGPLIIRECRQNCKINGFDIPEKTQVAINLYAIMRDKDSWDDPNKFLPERFLVSFKNQSDQVNSGQKFNFIPFGAGRRGCPGTTLAFSLLNATVASLVQCFDWKVDGDGDGGKVDMQTGPGLSVNMLHPLTARPVVHFNPFAASM